MYLVSCGHCVSQDSGHAALTVIPNSSALNRVEVYFCLTSNQASKQLGDQVAVLHEDKVLVPSILLLLILEGRDWHFFHSRAAE